MLGLLYYGRLEKEKGFDQLILAINELNNKNVDFEIFIFGQGSLESDLLEIKANNVHFFGRKSLSVIKQYLANIDYCVMPSEFLETFGLSALNALSRGLPVIGYKKGGLDPFIFQECNLFLAKGDTTAQKLISIIEKLAKKANPERLEDKSKFEKKIQSILPEYTEDAWIDRFIELSSCNQKETKKILIVSDFINKAGGIETYIHDVKRLLEAHGYKVILRGNNLPAGWRGKLKKKLGLITSRFNWRDARRFKGILKSENPDIIWFNSLLRRLGPNVVKVAGEWRKINNTGTKFWMMYHDFGYFYAFPSKLFNIENCKTPLTKENFMLAGRGKNIIVKCAVMFKYSWLQPLKYILKKEIDIHLTPSECITNIMSDSYQIANKKCKTFSHFIQK